MLVCEDLGRTILMNAMNAINATDAMNAATASTIEGTEQVRWDLSILYSGIDDPRLDSDLKALEAMAKHFADSYKGKLAERLGAAIGDYSEIEMLQGKIASYLSLRESTDLANAAIKAKHAQVQRELSAMLGEHLTFFELELVQLSDETLDGLV